MDGLYTWDLNGWARFPAARKIGISVNPFNQIGDALDVETGDAAPSDAPAWVIARRAAGAAQPWVYVNRSNQRSTEDAMSAAGIGLSEAAIWVATLDGTQSVAQYRYPIAAVQYANSAISGGHYDLSIVTTYGAGSGVLGGPTLTNADLIAVHDSIQDDLWGLIDTSVQSQNDFIFAVNHGTSVQSIIDGWKQNPQYAKWQAAKATIGQTAGQASLTPDEVRQLSEVDSLVGIANALKAELDTVQAKLTKDLA